MKRGSVRITVGIPTSMYRQLKEQAAKQGRPTRALILAGIEKVLLRSQRPHPRRVQFPLIRSKGPRVNLTNEQIYESHFPDANVRLALLWAPTGMPAGLASGFEGVMGQDDSHGPPFGADLPGTVWPALRTFR